MLYYGRHRLPNTEFILGRAHAPNDPNFPLWSHHGSSRGTVKVHNKRVGPSFFFGPVGTLSIPKLTTLGLELSINFFYVHFNRLS